MASSAPTHTALTVDREQMLAAMAQARLATLELVAHLTDDELERMHSPIMSPLVWDLAHIAAYEDLWVVHRYGGQALLRADLAEIYDAFETPRSVRGEIELLGVAEAKAYLSDVRQRTVEVIERHGCGDGVICEMVLRHELQHSETMRQTMAIAALLGDGEPGLESLSEPEGWIEIPAGEFQMGASEQGFSYDNERPRHTRHTGAFCIARAPVDNSSWIRFAEQGGYERAEWWSPEGWAWRQEHAIAPHPAIAAGHPDAPVCHISWFEADAFARAQGARLPLESEWERAAGWEPEPLTGTGLVWEWTASRFEGYEGFRAYPYREYSEVFFGGDYRVLRGGSWATHPRVRSLTFRNWDHPQRRQIFAGVRLARDL